MTSKADLIGFAFEEIGYASYVFDLMPEQINSALRRMEMLAASWDSAGISISYPLGEDSSQNVDCVPDFARLALYLNLAVLISPSLGKTVQPETKVAAQCAKTAMLAKLAEYVTIQMPGNMPAGAGNKPFGSHRRFIVAPSEAIETGNEGALKLE